MDLDDGWWVVMMVGMLLFWVLVVLAIFWLGREIAGRRGSAQETTAADPVATLDQRLAAGDISVEEYRERRALLTGSGTAER